MSITDHVSIVLSRKCAAAVFLVAGLLVAGLAIAEGIETIRLKNREAQDIIPVLRPFLMPGEVISGAGQLLLVRGSAETLSQFKKLIVDLDRKPRKLLITVRQVPRIGRSVPSDSSSTGPDGATPATRYITTRNRANEYRVTALEGQPVSIFTRSTAPSSAFDVFVAHYAAVVRSNPDYRETEKGFHAIASIVNDLVLLDIFSVREDASDWNLSQAWESNEFDTRVSLKPGEWFELAGTDKTPATRTNRSVVRSTGSGFAIEVKIELLQ